MKKLLAFIAVLFVSVVSSACINNFAIQELNSKAKEYLDKGNIDEAICRLESSVDLDANIFESRYNLGVAYIRKEEYKKAIAELNEAIKIKAASADAFYSLGVALEGDAFNKVEEEIHKTDNTEDETVSDMKNQAAETETAKEENLTSAEAQAAVDELEAAISAYGKYIELSQGASDSQKVKDHIQELKNTINEYQVKYIDPQSGTAINDTESDDESFEEQ